VQLKNLTFFSENGREIPLDALARITIVKGFGEIQRKDGKTYLSVKANTTSDNMGKIFEKVDQVMAGFEMPYGYSWTIQRTVGGLCPRRAARTRWLQGQGPPGQV